MRAGLTILAATFAVAAAQPGAAQNLTLPSSIAAGNPFTVQTQGSGNGTLYIVGPGQAIKRDVQLGSAVFFAAGSLYGAGQYTVVLTGAGANEMEPLTVTPSAKPGAVSFLARPSRLPVGLHDGITGAVYVFDPYKNLITKPENVSFDLTGPDGKTQTRTVPTVLGAAWTELDSTSHQGNDKFVARIGSVASTRIVGQVPGDPCSLKMTASPAGQDVRLQTDPIRDCSGNAVPDGTIVTFTENYRGGESTVDVPIKRGIAQVEMPAHPGATISVASGVMMGNQIRWER
ncbi:MAG: hypothetical protein ACLGSH_08895 [Acidobacteriota bacterium]